MRICSLVPGATEVVAALDLADQLVAVSHECDYPESVRHVPSVVEPMLDQHTLSSDAIDQAVKQLVSTGQRLYRLNEQRLLAARPDVILTQDLCHVCAVTPDQLTQAITALPSAPQLVTLNPTSMEDMLRDIERIAQAVGAPDRGHQLLQSLRGRLDRVSAAIRPTRPRVVCLEWLDPLYIAGHWVPEMVALAGGEDVLGRRDHPSRETTWQEVTDANPDILLIMPCGYSVQRTLDELSRLQHTNPPWSAQLARWPQTYVLDANSYFSRPGPRLVDGVELLAAILHPGPSHHLNPAAAVRLTTAALSVESRA
ncbi:cobalamin-binding protein [Nitrospira lenta]|uniref:ABC-type transport system periplasmic binding protein n=1 Tax=Nitrospira lenta TaxID=1436998 RepID=A0A330LCT8_9BACT|nr:cobalamin-binding protein [Nitrospira lenta]SPP66806.1 ABC-type transport system periplasmic binding protein [Nitrospira lenta]